VTTVAKKANYIDIPNNNIKMVNFRYIIAINLRSKVQLSLEQKDYENAISVLEIVFEKFKSAVFNKSIMLVFFLDYY